MRISDWSSDVCSSDRPQIAGHIREIRDYLDKPEAILPNPIVVAFTRGISVDKEDKTGRRRVSIDVSNGPAGLVVDRQQRLSALTQMNGQDFQVFVSAVVCVDAAALCRHFVLINHTRPLPTSLISALLPSVIGL